MTAWEQQWEDNELSPEEAGPGVWALQQVAGHGILIYWEIASLVVAKAFKPIILAGDRDQKHLIIKGKDLNNFSKSQIYCGFCLRKKNSKKQVVKIMHLLKDDKSCITK